MSARTKVRRDLHSPEDLKRLARSETVPRTARRMMAIAHVLSGMTFTDAAAAVGIERQSLGDAVKRYNAEGLDGLKDRPKPGRTPKLTEAQRDELKTVIEKGPEPETDGISAYTLNDLVAIVAKRFGVTYHPGHMSLIVRKLGFSRQKPRPFNPKKDEAAQAAFKGAL